jgi:DNA-binding IclR family transcriptional regulator
MPSKAVNADRPSRAKTRERTVAKPSKPASVGAQGWTFLTNHSHVLVCLLQDPSARLRDVADRIGITERAVQKIILDLETAGVLRRVREGRRNRYKIQLDLPLRHPVEAHCTIREVLSPIAKLATETG